MKHWFARPPVASPLIHATGCSGTIATSPGVPSAMPASFAGAKIELQDAAGALLARFEAVR
jgi:hypothetical protein